jgi:competence protein ComEC
MLLYIQLWLIEICAGFDLAFVETYFVDSMMFLFYYVMLALVPSISYRNYKQRLAIAVLLAANFLVFRASAQKTDEAEITFLYSGSSNSTVIKMPMGTAIMINAGSSTEKYYSANRSVIPYLRSNGINSLDMLVINSMDAAEFRNLLYFVNNFEIKKILLPVYYKQVLERKTFALNFSNIQVEYITSSKIINSKGSFRIYVYYDNSYKGPVMLSQFVYGDQSFIFDDASMEAENIYNTAYIFTTDLNTQVLRTAGGGSFLFTPAEFILKTDPEFVVIGESYKGRKRLNTEAFTSSLNEFGFNVLNTGTEGAVIMRTDGDHTRVVKWK